MADSGGRGGGARGAGLAPSREAVRVAAFLGLSVALHVLGAVVLPHAPAAPARLVPHAPVVEVRLIWREAGGGGDPHAPGEQAVPRPSRTSVSSASKRSPLVRALAAPPSPAGEPSVLAREGWGAPAEAPAGSPPPADEPSLPAREVAAAPELVPVPTDAAGVSGASGAPALPPATLEWTAGAAPAGASVPGTGTTVGLPGEGSPGARMGGVGGGDPGSGAARELGAYREQLSRRVLRERRYPAQAVRLRMEGTARVRVRVNRDGTLAEPPRLEGSSRFHVLDAEALRMVEAAAPFPSLPAGFARDSAEFVIPVSFSLRAAAG